jgi:hypothetical protein
MRYDGADTRQRILSIAAHDGRLDNTARTELLAAALRALDS